MEVDLDEGRPRQTRVYGIKCDDAKSDLNFYYISVYYEKRNEQSRTEGTIRHSPG